MNKALVKKYKKEFDHWLNDGTLLMANKNIKSWITLTNNTWDVEENFINDLLIVINDEYAEFRKALAEGKTVEYMTRTIPEKWSEVPIDCNFNTCHLHLLRIKPIIK